MSFNGVSIGATMNPPSNTAVGSGVTSAGGGAAALVSSMLSTTAGYQSEAYRDMLNRVNLFNVSLRQQRQHRLPFLDGATHVAQMPSHLYRQKWERLPAENPHQMCRYVSLRWKKRKLSSEHSNVVNDVTAFLLLNGRSQSTSHASALTVLLRPSANNASNSLSPGNNNSSKLPLPPDENSLGGGSWQAGEESLDHFPTERLSDDSDTEEAFTPASGRGRKPAIKRQTTSSSALSSASTVVNKVGSNPVGRPPGSTSTLKRGMTTSYSVASGGGSVGTGVSGGSGSLQCEYCHMLYRSKTGLSYHINTVHRGLSGAQARMTTHPVPTPPPPPPQASQLARSSTVSTMITGVTAVTSGPPIKPVPQNASAPPQLERGATPTTRVAAGSRLDDYPEVGDELLDEVNDGEEDVEDGEEDSMPPPTLQLMVGGDDTSQNTSSPGPTSPSSSQLPAAPLLGSVAGTAIGGSSSHCDICQMLVDKTPGVTRRWVTCSDCGRVEHCDCLKFTPNMELASQNYPWQCIECKTCWVCLKAENDEKMLFCDDCDRGYHLYCLKPPLNEPPEGNWSCSLCSHQWQQQARRPAL